MTEKKTYRKLTARQIKSRWGVDVEEVMAAQTFTVTDNVSLQVNWMPTLKSFAVIEFTQVDVALRAKLDQIVKEEVGTIETLETQNRDSLDFHEVHVRALRDMVKRAYELGRNESKQNTENELEALSITIQANYPHLRVGKCDGTLVIDDDNETHIELMISYDGVISDEIAGDVLGSSAAEAMKALEANGYFDLL